MSLVMIAGTLWLAALVATPRRPPFGNEVAELVYARLLGRREWLALLAAIATGAALLALILSLPARVDPDLAAVREARRYCGRAAHGVAACDELQPGGAWAALERRANGPWAVVAIAWTPPSFAPPVDGPTD